MIGRLVAWWRGGRLKRLEHNARVAAAVYASAKTLYETALIEARKKDD